MRNLLFVWALLLSPVAASAAAPHAPALDAHGDPLPQAADARLGTLRWRTGCAIHDLACSPDGKWLATADNYLRTARLWDAATGKLVRTFWGHRNVVNAVAFSPDGKRLLTAGIDNSVRVWDVTTGEQVRKIDLKMAPHLAGIAALPKGFVVFDTSQQLIRFDADGKEVGRAAFSTTRVPALAASGHVLTAPRGRPKGATLRVSSADGKQVGEIACDDYAEAALSPDGKLVAARLRKPGVKVWDAASGKELCSLSAEEVGKYPGPLSFSPDGKRLLGETERGKLRLWDVRTGKRLVELAGVNLNARVRAFSPDGKRLVVATHVMDLRVFDPAKGTRLEADDEAEAPLRCVAFSPDGKSLLAASMFDEHVRLWDVKSRRLVRRLSAADLGPTSTVYGVAFSRDGKRAAAAGIGRPVVVWDVATGKELHRFTVENGYTTAVLFSADDLTLFAAAQGLGVLRWDLKTGKPLDALKTQQQRFVTDLQLSRDGKTLAALSWVTNVNGTTTFWDVATGKEGRTVTVPSFSQRLTSDGKKLAGVDGRGKVQFYDAENGTVSHGWQGALATSLQLSPDDKSIATTYLQRLSLFDADGGHSRPVVLDFNGVSAMAQSPAAFSPDGKRLAVCDGPCVLLYDVRTLRRPPERPLPPGQWRWCWEVLGEKPLHLASEAQALLHAAGGSWAGEARRLLTPPPVDAKRVAKLLEAVRGDDKEESDEAVAELAKLGAGVLPLIDQAAKAEADADAKLKLLVARRKVPGPDPVEESLRAPRLAAALRLVDTKEAKALLADMAAGKFGSTWQKAAAKR